MSNKEIIKCKCGKEFTFKGYCAHRFYCKDYIDSLDKEEYKNYLDHKNKYDKKKKEINIEKKHKDSMRLEKWIKEKHKCKNCNKIMTSYYGNNGKFCCKQCACSWSAKQITEESKINLQKKRLKTYDEKRNMKLNNWIKEKHKCEVCSKIMTERYGSGRFCSLKCKINFISNYNANGIMSNILKERWKDPEIRQKYINSAIKSRKENGCHGAYANKGPSLGEKCWIRILNKLNINYEYNYLVKWSDLKVKSEKQVWYKFDFYLIDYNLDLEIDGSFHNKECVKEHDKIRDINVINGGYDVYRIDWYGYKDKDCVNKIKNFIQFLNKKAQELGTKLITENEFYEMIGE